MPQSRSRNQSRKKSQDSEGSIPDTPISEFGPLPSKVESERAVLGSAIMNTDSRMLVLQLMEPADFFLPAHRIVFETLRWMASENIPVDLTSVVGTLENQKNLSRAGGASELSGLIDHEVFGHSVRHNAEEVKACARKRSLIKACAWIQDQAFSEAQEIGVLLEKASKGILELMGEQGSNAMPSTWGQAVEGAMNQAIGAIRDPQAVMRLVCDVTKLDQMTAGLRREDLVLIVGGTSHGKSTLAQQYAINADNQGLKGLIFSAEMSKEAIATRELSHAANVPLYLLRRPEQIHSPDAVINKLLHAAAQESKRKLLVVDQGITPGRVWSLTEMVHKTQGLDFVIVDYDQLVVRGDLGKYENEYAEQARFVADALELAKRLHLCFILLCQPRKMDADVASGKRAPRIEEIFGSSAAGNTATVAIWIIRRFFQKSMKLEFEGDAAAYVLKARNDQTGLVEFGFDSQRVLFVDEVPGKQQEMA